jgi:hypothetical protein
MGVVRLHNKSNTSKTVRSLDGDSVILYPQRVATVDEKFTWSLPRDVRNLDDKPSPPSVPLIENIVTEPKSAGSKK